MQELEESREKHRRRHRSGSNVSSGRLQGGSREMESPSLEAKTAAPFDRNGMGNGEGVPGWAGLGDLQNAKGEVNDSANSKGWDWPGLLVGSINRVKP